MTGGDELLSGKVRILSDLHLGHRASLVGEVTELKPLLEGVDTVVFNGDTCELNCEGRTDRALKLLQELKALCDEVRVKAVFLTGNHDTTISECGWLDLWGGDVFVTHGDMAHREVAPWSREYLARKQRVAEKLAHRGDRDDELEDRWETAHAVEEVLRRASDVDLNRRGWLHLFSAFWPPRRPFAILWGWATMFAAARDLMKRYRPAARIMVFGHFHMPAVSWRDGCLLVNTGAFTHGSIPLVVDLEDGWLRVRRVKREKDGSFAPGTGWGMWRFERR